MIGISRIFNFPLKSAIFISFLGPLAGIFSCSGQSIVGKWKQVSVKAYCTPEGIARSNGHMKEVMEMPVMDAVDEFKSDNTFIETNNSGGKASTNVGKWTMEGNTVTLTVSGRPAMSGIYSASENTLVLTLPMPAQPHMTISKREYAYAKL